MEPETYLPRRASVSDWLDVRGLRLHVRRWPAPGAPRLVLAHGWMDVAASFQFFVDALSGQWDIVAPDLRGFGESAWDAGGYFFAQYLADLDAVLERYSPDTPVALLGHSLGGNIVCMYAGVRPARVSAVVSLDAWGLREADPADAPGRIEKWLRQLRHPETFRPHADFDELARRLVADNPLLGAGRAAFLARHLGEEDGLGGVQRAADPAHKHVSPALYRFAEVAEVWRRVTAPVLHVVADDARLQGWLGVTPDDIAARLAVFPNARIAHFRGCGHNLHLEVPERLAASVGTFLREVGVTQE